MFEDIRLKPYNCETIARLDVSWNPRMVRTTRWINMRKEGNTSSSCCTWSPTSGDRYVLFIRYYFYRSNVFTMFRKANETSTHLKCWLWINFYSVSLLILQFKPLYKISYNKDCISSTHPLDGVFGWLPSNVKYYHIMALILWTYKAVTFC